jgi:cytochrome c
VVNGQEASPVDGEVHSNRSTQGESMKRMIVAVALVVGMVGVARAAEDGAALYKSKCAACHGAAGEGGKMAPDPIAGASADSIAKVVNEGKGKMKPVKGLTDEQGKAIGAYVAGLKKK